MFLRSSANSSKTPIASAAAAAAPTPARKKRASSPAPAAASAAAAVPLYTHTYHGEESTAPSLLTTVTEPIHRTFSAFVRSFSGAESAEEGSAAAPAAVDRSDSAASSSWTFSWASSAPTTTAAPVAVPRSDSAESWWPFTTASAAAPAPAAAAPAITRSESAESTGPWWPFTTVATAAVEGGDGAAASSNFFGGLLRTFSMGEPSALGRTASGELPGDSAPAAAAAAPAPMLGRIPSALPASMFPELWWTPSATSEAAPL